MRIWQDCLQFLTQQLRPGGDGLVALGAKQAGVAACRGAQVQSDPALSPCAEILRPKLQLLGVPHANLRTM